MAVRDGAGFVPSDAFNGFKIHLHGASAVVENNLVSLAITPDASSVVLGLTKTLTCTATYATGATKNVTSEVTWSTSDAGITSAPAASGVSTSAGVGTATITATLGTVSDTTTLQVTAATLSSISVTPKGAAVVAGATQAFVATGTYSDGTTATITGSVTWTSSATGVTGHPNGSGVTTSVAVGTATLTATSGAVSGTAFLAVTGASDATAPVVTWVSPDPDVPAGDPGGFPADYATAIATPIVLQVTDAVELTSVVLYVLLRGQVELVYGPDPASGEATPPSVFFAPYATASTVDAITDGFEFSVERDGGWGPGTMKFMALAVDAAGNVES